MHQSLQGATFHVEHTTPKSRGGKPELDNLALACPACNLHKADRIDVEDSPFSTPIALFNPRRHVWSEHFRWDGCQMVGLTSIGRTTIAALKLNDRTRVLIRRAESLFGLFPPES